VRLRDEGYHGSHSTIQRYVRHRKEEMARKQHDSQGYLQLDWLAGEVQVNFGEVSFKVRDAATGASTSPSPSPAPTWCPPRPSGCMPRRAVSDNATEVGGRVGGEVRASDLFRRFAAHHGLDYILANPYSRNEKGNVENKVGS
jgi:hypothetical protein